MSDQIKPVADHKLVRRTLIDLDLIASQQQYVRTPAEQRVRTESLRNGWISAIGVGGSAFCLTVLASHRLLRYTKVHEYRYLIGTTVAWGAASIFNRANREKYLEAILAVPNSPVADEARSIIEGMEGRNGPWLSKHAPQMRREDFDEPEEAPVRPHVELQDYHKGYELIRTLRPDAVPQLDEPLSNMQTPLTVALKEALQTAPDDPRRRLFDMFPNDETPGVDPVREIEAGWLSFEGVRRQSRRS